MSRACWHNLKLIPIIAEKKYLTNQARKYPNDTTTVELFNSDRFLIDDQFSDIFDDAEYHKELFKHCQARKYSNDTTVELLNSDRFLSMTNSRASLMAPNTMKSCSNIVKLKNIPMTRQ